jgi:hypothetical protein
MAEIHHSACPLCRILGETNKLILSKEKGILKLRLEIEDVQTLLKVR